jgi:hypothetical protein
MKKFRDITNTLFVAVCLFRDKTTQIPHFREETYGDVKMPGCYVRDVSYGEEIDRDVTYGDVSSLNRSVHVH